MSSEKKESDCESSTSNCSTSCMTADVTSTDTPTCQPSASTYYDDKQYGNTSSSVSDETTTEMSSTSKMQSYGNQTHTAFKLDYSSLSQDACMPLDLSKKSSHFNTSLSKRSQQHLNFVISSPSVINESIESEKKNKNESCTFNTSNANKLF